MEYEIIGNSFPAVRCKLTKGETMKCEGGSMSWMDDEIVMSTEGGGGLGKALGRALAGEKIFFNKYKCEGEGGEIVFSSSFPGCIVPVKLAEGQSIIAQKTGFLACEDSVDVSVHVHEKLGGAVFGGMGFVMQKFTGPGTVFIEVDGALEEYDIPEGDKKIVDGPHLAIISDGVRYEIQKIKGMKNVILGGEGLFNTVVYGPGKVWLQTMPIANVATAIAKYIPTSSD